MKFKALIDDIHFDPKKGTVKIVLVGASHVSLDELITVGPKDESIWVTLESEQTKIKVFPLVPDDVAFEPKDARGRAIEPGSQEERELEEGRIITEFPTEEANPDDVPGDGDPITLDEEAAVKLKEAAERLREEEDVNIEELVEEGQRGIV